MKYRRPIITDLLFTLLLLVFLPSSQMLAQETGCETLIWVDEFNINGAPATDKWDYDLGGNGWGNNELQTYTNNRANSWVENGKLYIKALKTNNNWTSARLVTRAKGDWLYGRIEVKAKLPSGKGTWPAIWMLPTDWAYGNWPASGEIDIMEHVGFDPGNVHGTAHTEAYYHSIGTQKGGSINVPDAMSNFHVYAIEWDEEKIKWFMDGQLYFTFTNEHKTYKEWPFDKRFHLLLNIAIGGDWGGAQGIDPNLAEAILEVDYVRVYHSKLPKPVITGSTLFRKNEETTFSVNPVDGASYQWSLPEGAAAMSGATTNQVTVKWHDAPGDLQVEISNDCEVVASDAFHVNYWFKPEPGQLDILPENNVQELLWKAVPGQNNSINLDAENDELIIGFQVASPAENAYIQYDFENLTDLSGNNELAFELKIDLANPPSNMRIDLVDANGNVNLSNLFKIEEFAADNQFHFYSHEFETGTGNSFLLDRTAQIRIYINYGVLGQSGNGGFNIKNLRLQKSNATSANEIHKQLGFNIYPNPASENIIIQSGEMIWSIQLFSITGQLLKTIKAHHVKEYSFSVSGMKPGTYLLKVNEKPAEIMVVR